MLDECIDYRPGVFAGHSDQHHVAGVSLYQRCDLTVVAADDQVTFPMTRDRSIFHCDGPLTYRDGASNPAVSVCSSAYDDVIDAWRVCAADAAIALSSRPRGPG